MATKAKWQYQSIRVAMPGGAFGEVQKSLCERSGGRPKESGAPHQWRRESQRTRALLLVLFLWLPAPSSIFTLVASYQMAAAQLTFLTFLYTLSAVPIVVVIVVAQTDLCTIFTMCCCYCFCCCCAAEFCTRRPLLWLFALRSLGSLCFCCFKYIIQYNKKKQQKQQ